MPGPRGHHPRGAALIAAAVDCRRAGFAGPLPRLLLDELHSAYLEQTAAARSYPETLAQAWSWAVRPRNSGSAPLRYTMATTATCSTTSSTSSSAGTARLPRRAPCRSALSYGGSRRRERDSEHRVAAGPLRARRDGHP